MIHESCNQQSVDHMARLRDFKPLPVAPLNVLNCRCAGLTVAPGIDDRIMCLAILRSASIGVNQRRYSRAVTSTEPETPIKPESTEERSTWEAYYGLQYERVTQHEALRTQLSAAVIAASGVALGIVGLAQSSPWIVVPILCAVVVANASGALVARNSRLWVKIHQERAEGVLGGLSPNLLKLQMAVNESMGVAAHARDRNAWVRSDRLLILIHLTLIGVAVVLTFVLPHWA